MSETTAAVSKPKESGFHSAVGSIWAQALNVIRQHGAIGLLLALCLWRVDAWITDMRAVNKQQSEAVMKMAIDNARLVEQNTAQSKQTQTAIEKFTDATTSQQRSVERVLDRLERNSSALKPTGRAPVIE